EVSVDVLGDDIKFLQDNLEVDALVHNDKVLKITLPIFIESEIIHTEPGFKGDSSRSGNKPATIDTEAIIQVPLFVEIGEIVKIDTRTGEYVERVKK
ncbi:Translation elongation factor P, partial [hydrothermal vent metagenome]